MSTGPNAVIKPGASLKECSRSKSGLAQRAVFDRPSKAHRLSAKRHEALAEPGNTNASS